MADVMVPPLIFIGSIVFVAMVAYVYGFFVGKMAERQKHLPNAPEEGEIEVEPMRNYDPTESIRQTRKSIDEWIAKKVDK